MPISDRTIPTSQGAGRAGTAPALFAALALLGLAACDDSFGAPGARPGAVLDSATLDEGSIRIKGPAGYCVDGTSLRDRGPKQFALLAQCDLLRSNEVAGVTSLAFITVTAVRAEADAPLPSAESIAKTFGPATVLYSAVIDDIRIVQLNAGGTSATDQADPVHWRGVLNANGHAIGLAAYSMQDGSGAGLEGRNLLLRLARNIRNDSGARAATGDGVKTAPGG